MEWGADCMEWGADCMEWGADCVERVSTGADTVPGDSCAGAGDTSSSERGVSEVTVPGDSWVEAGAAGAMASSRLGASGRGKRRAVSSSISALLRCAAAFSELAQESGVIEMSQRTDAHGCRFLHSGE